MCRRTLAPVVSVIALMLMAMNPSPAHAAPSHGAGNVVLELGAKGSWQRVQWNLSKQIVHLGVKTGASMNRNRCQEASFDWRVRSRGGHYDQRTVRNCKPGSYVSTDPGGDAYWNEPSDWDGRAVNGVFAAGALVIADTSLKIVDKENEFGDRTEVYGAGTDHKPVATEGQYLVAMRTLYESGKIISTRTATSPESCIAKSKSRCNGRG